MLYFDILEPIKVLPDADKGRLLVAMLEYGQSGMVPEFEGMLALAWGFVKPKIDKDSEEYNRTILKRQYATFCRDRKRKGEPEVSFEEWLMTIDDQSYQMISHDTKWYGFASDSRELLGSAEQQINVIAYAKPLVIPLANENAILCYRSDGNGIRTGTSTSVWIKAARSYYKVTTNGTQKNFCALQWRRKLATEDWNDSTHLWSDLLTKSNLSADHYSGLLSGVVFDLQKAYTVQIRVIDDVGEADTKTLEVPTRDVALHLGKGGKNVSIGSFCDYSEDYTFYSAWKAIFGGGFEDKTDTGWQPINSNINYRATCGYVTIVGISSGDMMLTGGGYTTVGTIPEQFAPDIRIPVVCHFQGGDLISQSGFLTTSGNIELYVSGGGTAYWSFTIIYPIKT